MSTKKRCYYEVLGLQKDASEDEIKRAYKKLALKFHPDRHANATEEEKEQLTKQFQELLEAYEILSTPEKKTQYDRFGHSEEMKFSGFDSSQFGDIFQQFFGTSGGKFQSKHSRGGFGGSGASSFGDFGGGGFGGGGFGGVNFEDFFGSKRGQRDHCRTAYDDYDAPQDVKTSIEFPLVITLDECYNGCIKKRKLTRSFLKGTKEDKIVEMNILPGMKEKTKFKFAGYGDEYSCGKYQDVAFVLEYKPSDFKAINSDLHYEVSMDFKKYLRGESITIVLPGDRKLDINSKNITCLGGENLFVGYGMPKRQKSGFGDLKLVLKLTNACLKEPIKI